MRYSLLIIAALFTLTCSAQLEKKLAEEAGEHYAAGEYAKADSLYNLSLSQNPEWLEATFNKGDALYRGGDFDGAAEQFTKIASKAQDKELKSEAYHNLGNTHMSKQEFDKAAASYRNALINDPSNEDSRYNLAYAQKLLQQQQQQEQEQDQEGDEGEEGDENKDGEKGDQEQEGDENKDGEQDENKEGEDQEGKDEPQDKEGEQDKNEGKDGEQKEQEGEQAQPLQLSPEEAARILESLKQDEKKVQAKVQQQKSKGKKVKIDKDW